VGDAWGGSWGSSWSLSWTTGGVVVPPTPSGGGGGLGIVSYKRIRKYREEYEEEIRALQKERAAVKKKLVVKEREQQKLEETIEDKVAASRQETAHLRAVTKSQMQFRLRIQAINAALEELKARIAIMAFEEDEEEVAMLLLH
jgi:septal ring factor EnvC (AmiA/AmiB activator)